MSPNFGNLVAVTAEKNELTKATTEAVLRTFFEELASAVWGGGRVNVPGLGLFDVRSRRARLITNPLTGEPMRLPRVRAVFCRVAKAWRTRG